MLAPPECCFASRPRRCRAAATAAGDILKLNSGAILFWCAASISFSFGKLRLTIIQDDSCAPPTEVKSRRFLALAQIKSENNAFDGIQPIICSTGSFVSSATSASQTEERSVKEREKINVYLATAAAAVV